MNNTDKLVELIESRSEEQLNGRLAAIKLQNQQDLLSLGCYLIATQTTSALIGGLCGMSDGKDNERYQAQFLGGGDTIK